MRTAALLTLVLVVPALAGCLAPGDDALAPQAVLDPARVLPYLDTSDAHDHAHPAQHDAGWGLDPVGWQGYTEDGKVGRSNQVVVHGDLAFVTAYSIPPAMKPGLIVVDLADPAAPAVVSTWTDEFTTPIDVHLSEDGRFAALAGHRLNAATPPLPQAVGCTTVPLPGRPANVCPPFAPAGIQLLDVSDPAAPTRVAWWDSVPSGAHTVKLATIDGELYAFIASYGFSYLDRLVSGVEILRFDAAAPTGFELVARFLPEQASGGGVFVHDVWIAPHAATGETLLWVAYWDGGVVIANVDDPAHPKQIAAWKDFDAATYGNVHFVRPMDALVDGRLYAVAAPEFGSAEHAGESYVLDVTDPAAPKLLAKWRLPGDPVSPGGYMHSPHNFDLTDEGLLVMGHYHAGVWALDLRPVFAAAAAGGAAAIPEPTVIGYRFTVPPAGADLEIPEGAFAPDVWNAVWFGDGLVVASDQYTGLHVLRFAPPAPGSPAPYEGLV